jgi:hypothetical protein
VGITSTRENSDFQVSELQLEDIEMKRRNLKSKWWRTGKVIPDLDFFLPFSK